MNKKQKRIIVIYLSVMILSIIVPPTGGVYYANTSSHLIDSLIEHGNINDLHFVKENIVYQPVWHGINNINYSALLMQDVVFLLIFIGLLLLCKTDN